MSSLKLLNVNKVYHSGSLALYDINLDASEGEFLVIFGGESCGKSSLLKVIAGLEEPTSGGVIIDDKDVTDAPPKDRNIAMVFRSDTLYPALTVYDNMAFGLKIRKTPPAVIDRKVRIVADVLNLSDVLLRKPKTLNSSQRQRVAIGRALVREPKLYLFDEPFSGLDNKLRAEMLNLTINLQARLSGTFIYATKNLSEALTIGTRVAVLKEGILQQVDSPLNLYDYPVNAYVAFLVGSPTISFINGVTIVKKEDGYFAENGELKFELPQNILSRFCDLSAYADTQKPVILGIRPEDAEAAKEGIPVKVTQIDKEGENRFAHCDLFGHDVVAKTQKENPCEAKLLIDLTRLYIFDGETRLTLLSRGESYKAAGPQADYIPPTFPDEEEIKKKFKPQKELKKKR